VKQLSTVFLFLSMLLMVYTPGYGQQPQEQPQAPPPPAPGTTTVIQPPPLPPQPPEVLQQDEGTFSLEPEIWLPEGHPVFNTGRANTTGTPAYVSFSGRNKLAFGGSVRIPAVKRNAIRITYFNIGGAINYIAPVALNLWSGDFNAGDNIVSDYHLQSVNLSFDFLTWPYPPRARRFRLKTLWQVQYINASTSFYAPLSTSSTASGSGSGMIILPALGLGVTEYVSKKFRLEVNASGFGIPHHTALANADADIAYQIWGPVELHAGGRLLYFKTSPQSDYYLKGNLMGAFFGLRLGWR
jgi:hypothetical protein